MIETFNKVDEPTRFARVITELRPNANFSIRNHPDGIRYQADWATGETVQVNAWQMTGLNHSQVKHLLKPLMKRSHT